jgi:hypothetical protein
VTSIWGRKHKQPVDDLSRKEDSGFCKRKAHSVLIQFFTDARTLLNLHTIPMCRHVICLYIHTIYFYIQKIQKNIHGHSWHILTKFLRCIVFCNTFKQKFLNRSTGKANRDKLLGQKFCSMYVCACVCVCVCVRARGHQYKVKLSECCPTWCHIFAS